MNTTRIKPEDTRALLLATLRKHGHQARTSELSALMGLPSSVVRRAGLYLASKEQLDATLEPGRGKGEYVFTIRQLDLFEDAPKDMTIWQRIKRWFQ